MRDRSKLGAFEHADEVTILIYRITRGFQKEEMYGLTSQIRIATISAPSNTDEGSAKRT